LKNKFSDMAKFTQTYFPIIGFKLSSVRSLALKPPNKIRVWYLRTDRIRDVYFLMDTVLCIINFILRWHIYIQNNNITATTSCR
jgi:hypothetical protein